MLELHDFFFWGGGVARERSKTKRGVVGAKGENSRFLSRIFHCSLITWLGASSGTLSGAQRVTEWWSLGSPWQIHFMLALWIFTQRTTITWWVLCDGLKLAHSIELKITYQRRPILTAISTKPRQNTETFPLTIVSMKANEEHAGHHISMLLLCASQSHPR